MARQAPPFFCPETHCLLLRHSRTSFQPVGSIRSNEIRTHLTSYCRLCFQAKQYNRLEGSGPCRLSFSQFVPCRFLHSSSFSSQQQIEACTCTGSIHSGCPNLQTLAHQYPRRAVMVSKSLVHKVVSSRPGHQ